VSDIKAKLEFLREQEQKIKEKHRKRKVELQPDDLGDDSCDDSSHDDSWLDSRIRKKIVPGEAEVRNEPVGRGVQTFTGGKDDSMSRLRTRLRDKSQAGKSEEIATLATPPRNDNTKDCHVASPPRDVNVKEEKMLKHVQNERVREEKLDLPGFTVEETDHGMVYYRETRFQMDYKHGGTRLRELLEIPEEIVDFLSNESKSSKVDFRKALFLDTETTGLAGGTGTLPFLIGVGFIEDDSFVVRQYFSPDYQYEHAKLEHINELMRRFPHLVTFNGRAFDMPIVTSRMVLSRMKPAHYDPPHLDLLFPARRLWKRTIGSCKLTSLERAVLRFHRHDDIPGWMIPSIYIEYLEHKNFYPLEQVFVHNLFDIITMAALLPGMWEHLEMAENYKLCSMDHFSMGRIYEKKKERCQAVEHYEAAMTRCKDEGEKREIAKSLTKIFKKNKEFEKAVPLWEEMAANSRIDISAHLELSKYYEHHVKDYEKALKYVEDAMEMVYRKRAIGALTSFYKEQEAVIRRIERIKKKIEKCQQEN
jgi:uncharacterized protein